MGTAGKKMAGSARDTRINLVPFAQAQKTSCWCTKSNTDSADLVVMIVIMMAHVYCTLSISRCDTMLRMRLSV